MGPRISQIQKIKALDNRSWVKAQNSRDDAINTDIVTKCIARTRFQLQMDGKIVEDAIAETNVTCNTHGDKIQPYKKMHSAKICQRMISGL